MDFHRGDTISYEADSKEVQDIGKVQKLLGSGEGLRKPSGCLCCPDTAGVAHHAPKPPKININIVVRNGASCEKVHCYGSLACSAEHAVPELQPT